jgi:two-component system, sensor histidine kinase and response regulator
MPTSILDGIKFAAQSIEALGKYHSAAGDSIVDTDRDRAGALNVEGGTLRVLIVEDSADNRLLIRTYLRKLACEVDEAENGEVGVDKFIAGSYDVVLMDLHMPVMNGVDALRRIRRWEHQNGTGQSCVIALTASALDDEMLQMRDAGADAELRKPISKATLFEAIQTMMRTRGDGPRRFS